MEKLLLFSKMLFIKIASNEFLQEMNCCNVAANAKRDQSSKNLGKLHCFQKIVVLSSWTDNVWKQLKKSLTTFSQRQNFTLSRLKKTQNWMEARGSNLDLSSSPAFYPKPHLVSKWKVPKKEQYYQLYFEGGSRKEKAALHTVLENF